MCGLVQPRSPQAAVNAYRARFLRPVAPGRLWRSAAAAAADALSCSHPCKKRAEHRATLVGAALGRLDVDDRSVSRKPPVAVVEAIVAHRPGPKRGTIQLVLLKTVKRRVEGGRDEGVVTK